MPVLLKYKYYNNYLPSKGEFHVFYERSALVSLSLAQKRLNAFIDHHKVPCTNPKRGIFCYFTSVSIAYIVTISFKILTETVLKWISKLVGDVNSVISLRRKTKTFPNHLKSVKYCRKCILTFRSMSGLISPTPTG